MPICFYFSPQRQKTNGVYDYFTYGVACSEVEIDVLTGESQVLQSNLYVDCGKSLNPAVDIGQIEGAFVQGLGMVTSENMEIDEKGRLNTCSPLGYKIPNIKSIPRKFVVKLLKNHDIVTNIYSSKSVGEPPFILSLSVLAAIKAAIQSARAQIGITGYFRLDCPATVQRIQEACGQQIKL
ncbi:xanthine dehydrogenase/oxidase-like [Ruditapes philippinarum]|uniref:xanthine dehydrogenase/oxidase-like n=1 Tax=Ruditapes philippinarum TaxID=129788 RepID=UPI00295BDE1B|nr:xanthine dehydrogenase/oxidase-like [Ruditapes philippinarum]